MPDHTELLLSTFVSSYNNHSDDLLASQVVSLAIQLGHSKEKNDIIPKITLAYELIENAKQIINTKKMEAKKHR